MPPTAYQSDLSDAEWSLLFPLLPVATTGCHGSLDLHHVCNAIFYTLRSGCTWRLLPSDFPKWQSVYYHFRSWRKSGTWERLNTALREQLRLKIGREATPSAGSFDSQSVKTAEQGGERGYDGAKKIKGRKRHILVDTEGLLMKVKVHSAGIAERQGAKLLLETITGQFERLKRLWADRGYNGPNLALWVKQELSVSLVIVQHLWAGVSKVWVKEGEEPPVDPRTEGFAVLPRRWVVERTFGWFNRYRRLSKDYEFLCETSEAFIYAASVRLMLRRLVKG